MLKGEITHNELFHLAKIILKAFCSAKNQNSKLYQFIRLFKFKLCQFLIFYLTTKFFDWSNSKAFADDK